MDENIISIEIKHKGKIYTVTVSREDEDLTQDRWHISSNGGSNIYVRRDIRKNHIYLHREVAKRKYGSLDNLKVDHIDGNTLDNCRSNIRLVNPQESALNRRKYRTWRGKPCTSKFIGVSYEKKSDLWLAYVDFNYERFRVGRFTDEVLAARARDAEALELHGPQFAVLNFPLPDLKSTSEDEDSPIQDLDAELADLLCPAVRP